MKRKGLLKTLLLLCALVVGGGSVWAEDKYVEFTASGVQASDAITETNWSNSYVTHRWTAKTSDNSYTIYFGGEAGKQSSMIAVKNTHFFGNIDPSYDSEKSYTIPTGAVGAIPGYITKIEVSCGGTTTRGIYIKVHTSQIVGNTSAEGIVTSDKLTGESVSQTYNKANKYQYFSISGGNSSYSGINSVKVYYEEASSDPSSAAAFANETPSISFPAQTTYSQTATTATGYTGTVTYTITANTAGATIEGSTVTVTKEGSVTVKAVAPAVTGSWAESEATYTLTVTDTRSANGLAFADAAKEVTVGEVLDAPTLTNPYSLSVTYSSNDETIATVDAEGNVTGVAVGTTTIIATFAGDDDYKSGSVSYTLTVNKAPFVITDGVFDFRENEDYGSGVAKSGVKEQTSTWIAVNVTMYMEGRNCWYSATPDNIRLYKASGGAAAGAITLSVPTGYVITKIDFTGASFNNLSAASGTFITSADYKTATWEGISNSIKFTASDRTDISTITVTYIPIPSTLTHTVTSAGWATYAPAFPVSFAEHEAYIINIADDNEAVLTEVSSVPAGTAVLLKGAGEHTMTTIASSSTDVSDNCLKVSDGSITKDDNVYVLADGNYGVGFYLWIGETALSKGKIYMEPNAVTARVFIGLSEGGVLGIDAVNVHADREVIFDLQGRRVAQPKKGLYIVNGKKYAY